MEEEKLVWASKPPIYALVKMLVSAMYERESLRVDQREMTPELVKEYMEKWKHVIKDACEYLSFDFFLKEAIAEATLVLDYISGKLKPKTQVTITIARQLFSDWMETTINECNQIIISGIPGANRRLVEARLRGTDSTLFFNMILGSIKDVSEEEKEIRKKVYMESYLCFKRSLLLFREQFGYMTD